MSVNVRVLKGRLILKVDDRLIEVKKFAKAHLLKGMGYYTTEEPYANYVYIYQGKLRPNDYKEPGSIYKVSDDNFIFVDHREEDRDKYLITKCTEIDANKIKKAIKERSDFKVLDQEVLDNFEGEIFNPPIRPTDDIFKIIIKKALEKLQINLKSLRHKFQNDYDLNNLKSQLIKEGNMSSKYFTRWVEVLDIDVRFVIADKAGYNRLDKELVVLMQ